MDELQKIYGDVQKLLNRVPDYQATAMALLATDSSQMNNFLSQKIVASSFKRFLDLHVVHPLGFFNSRVFDRLLVYLVSSGDVTSLRQAAQVHTHARGLTVPEAMASCANRVALLRIAIRTGQPLALLWLIAEAKLEPIHPPSAPTVVDFDFNTTAFDTSSVRELASRVTNDEVRTQVLAILDRVISRRLFTQWMVRNGVAASHDEINDLIHHITNVADLRIFIDSTQHLPLEDQRRLAAKAFNHALEEPSGLLLDVHAAAYFMVIVKGAKKRTLVPAGEAEVLLVRRTQANIASANCIRVLSRSVTVLQAEMVSVRTGFRSIVNELTLLRNNNNDYARMRREQRTRLVFALSTLLFGFGGEAFHLLGCLVDLSRPVDLFTSLVRIDRATVGHVLAD